jgi:WD40 repeat protein
MTDIFISYSRRDEPFVRRLVTALEGRDKDVWVDVDDIPKTAEWWAQIQQGIREANAFAFVISPHSLASDVCHDEVAEATAATKRMVPIKLRDPGGAELPERISAHNWIDFSEPDRFDAAFAELVEALEIDLEWVEAHTLWLARAHQWEASGRDRSRLLRGAELRSAEAWHAGAAAKQPPPSALHLEHLLASRRDSARRSRMIIAAVTTALVVAVALSVIALVQRHRAIEQRELATARELVATSSLNLQTDPELSIALAARAARLRSTPEAEAALRRAIVASPVRVTLPGSTGATSVALAPDGEHASVSQAVGTGDRTVIRDARDGRVTAELSPGVRFQAARFSPDGDRLLAAHLDGRVRIWPVAGGEPLALPARGLNDAAWVDDERVVTGGEDGSVTVWEAGSQKPVQRLAAGGEVYSVAATGTTVAAGKADGSVQVWDLRSERLGLAGRLQLAFPATVTLSEDGSRLLAYGGEVHRAWDVPSGRVLSGGPALAAALSRDGQSLAVAARNTAPAVIALSDGRRSELTGHRADVVALAFSPDDATVAAGDADGRTTFSRTADGVLTDELPPQNGGVVDVSYDAGGRVATAGYRAPVRIWHSRLVGRELPVLSVPGEAAAPGGGTVVATAGAPLAVDATGAVVDPGGGVGGVVNSAISGDGAAAVGASLDGAVRLQELRTGRSLADGTGAPRAPDVLVAAPDAAAAFAGWDEATDLLLAGGDAQDAERGRASAVATDGRVLLTDSGRAVITGASGDRIAAWDLPVANSVEVAGAFSAEGDRIALATDDVVEVREADGGALVRSVKPGENGAVAVALSGDGTVLATAGRTGVLVQDLATGRALGRFSAPDDLKAMTMTADGRLVTAADVDSHVHVWEVTSGAEVLTVWGDAGAVAPGETAVRSLWLDRVYEWPCDACLGLEDLLTLADARVTRPLTPDERARYLHD